MSQERIQQINEEIVRLEKRKGEGVSMQGQEQIDAQIKGLEMERADLEAEQQATDKHQRELVKVAIVGTYMDTLSQMFEALLPSDTFRSLFGINDYEEKRAQFYQLSQAYTGEAIDAQHQQFEEIIASKDERIKALNAQSLVDRHELDAVSLVIIDLKSAHEQAVDDVNGLEEALKESESVIDNLRLQYKELETRYNNLWSTHQSNCDTINDLTNKLETAQQVKEESKPSAKVTDLIEQIKSKNDIAPDDFIARWNARQKDDSVKLEIAETSQQESPSTESNATQPTSDQLSSAEATQTVEAPTFQTSEPTDVQGIPIAMAEGLSGESGASGETPVTRSELERRLAQHKAEIIAEIQGAA